MASLFFVEMIFFQHGIEMLTQISAVRSVCFSFFAKTKFILALQKFLIAEQLLCIH